MADTASQSLGDGRSRGADILALGFGTTVAMWAVGYICRFPAATVPGWLLLVLLLACLLVGGFLAGRYAPRSWRGGIYTGLLVGILNLLVLGSLLGGTAPNQIVPSALWWLPGSLLISAVLAATGALVGARMPGTARTRQTLALHGTTVFASVAAAATFLLLIAGGIVTSNEAGLAVVDWPNSFGYNMFLYPLSRMTGDIYYEHVHRLLGSLVGLTTLVLAVYLQRTETRRWVRRFALAALLAVVLQGILGGLRVTGRFTLSDSAAMTAPSITLAIVHGVLGQIFFGMMVALAIFCSRRWRSADSPEIRPAASLDHSLSRILVGLLVVQLVLGAILRHMAGGLLIHITFAGVVFMLALAVGVRVWGQYEHISLLKKLGNALFALLAVQLTLGLGAWIATGTERAADAPHPADVIVTTLHQATGAVLLACTVALMLWLHKLVRPRT